MSKTYDVLGNASAFSKTETDHYIILDIDECLTRTYLDKQDEEGAVILEKMMKSSNIKNRNRFYRIKMKDYDSELKKEIIIGEKNVLSTVT